VAWPPGYSSLTLASKQPSHFFLALDLRLAARMQANIRKFYLFQFLLNFQLWWPIWVIYLTEERGLTLGQVTLIDVPSSPSGRPSSGAKDNRRRRPRPRPPRKSTSPPP